MLCMPICYLCKFNSDSDSHYRFFLCEWNVSISVPLTKRWKVKTFSFHRQRKLRLGLSSTLLAPFIHAFILRKKKKEETFCEHYPGQGWRVSGAYPVNTACKVVRQWFKFLGKLKPDDLPDINIQYLKLRLKPILALPAKPLCYAHYYQLWIYHYLSASNPHFNLSFYISQKLASPQS